MTFKEFPSYKKLLKLSKKLPDLTDSSLLTKERIGHYLSHHENMILFYGTERVDDEILEALKSLSQESLAITKMQAMQQGEIMNSLKGIPCENRACLHTATRDFFQHHKHKPGSNLYWIVEKSRKENEKLKNFETKLQSFNHLVQIGIGGSHLGPQAVYHGLSAYKRKGITVHFLSNVDPDSIASILREIDLRKTLFVSVSKSGTTQETSTNEEIIRQILQERNIKPEEHFVAVTQENSSMDNKANYLEVFHLWDSIGGRFSTTSMVGGLVLTYAFGFENWLHFLKGAHNMDELALVTDLKQNLPLMAALLTVWNTSFCHLPTLAVIPYSSALDHLVDFLQQLEMESNGKQIDKETNPIDFELGPILWGQIGTDAEHSFFQLLHQGPHQTSVEFIGFSKPSYEKDFVKEKTTSQQKLLSHLFAQMISLATGQKHVNPNQDFKGNRQAHLLLIDQLSPYTIGSLVAFYEHKVSFEAFIWDVNPFDQEGVQLGKKIMHRMLHLYQNEKEYFPLGEAFLDTIENIEECNE
jgi:glucose-6-phosphate isomerase